MFMNVHVPTNSYMREGPKKNNNPAIPWLVYDEMDVSRDRKLILIAIRTVASSRERPKIYEVEAREQLGVTLCMATDCKVFPCPWCQLYFQVRCCFSWQHKRLVMSCYYCPSTQL